ncbi:MAG: phosphate signaling complex protein PhoU [Thermodesulfobacteriota bacterium]|nr:phosphate signaling complex protein PhoU [Thermodesulfobacteriota bacterium]
MAGNLQKEIDKIKKEILSLGAMVEERFKKAIVAVKTNDAGLAKQIIDSDVEIDELEVEIEEECLKILALYQPVAIDLRFLIAVVKINNDLERVADLAVNICIRVMTISGKNLGEYSYDYFHMAEKAGLMLKMSLDALVAMDSNMAVEVIKMDKDVNIMRNEAYDAMKKAIVKAPGHVGRIVNRYLISRHLERIGDHVTNIAEEVIHMIEGKIVRHGIE